MSTVEEILKKEWDDLKTSGLLNQICCTAAPKRNGRTRDLFHWNALMRGPKNSPYHGYMFQFEIEFKKGYPNEAPVVKYKPFNDSNIYLYHMNISEDDGDICVSSIKKDYDNPNWKPAPNISEILLSIFVIFCKPNPDSPYRGDLAELYNKDKEKYEQNIKEHCAKYCLKFSD